MAEGKGSPNLRSAFPLVERDDVAGAILSGCSRTWPSPLATPEKFLLVLLGNSKLNADCAYFKFPATYAYLSL